MALGELEQSPSTLYFEIPFGTEKVAFSGRPTSQIT